MRQSALIDTHAHLDAQEFEADRDAVIERAAAHGVAGVVTVGIDLESSRVAIALAQRYPQVVAAVGVHPHAAAAFDENVLRELCKLAASDRVVAIGEIGLDYYRDRAPRARQREAFAAQLQLASELGLPVVVHDREAHVDVYEALRAQNDRRALSGVVHCFSGDVRLAEKALALGFYVSLAGPVTYPKSEGLADVARVVPAARLLVETDCPFLAPQAVRGRRNEPAYVRHTIERIAALRLASFDTIARQTTMNARQLFGERLPAGPSQL